MITDQWVSDSSHYVVTAVTKQDNLVLAYNSWEVNRHTTRYTSGGGSGAVVECPTRDRKVPGSIPGGAKK